MIHLYTGNGKGKTTAALGLALRALGDGKKVFMMQFIKGPWPSGEDKSHQVFGEDFVLVKGGKGFVGILGDQLPREEHEKAARETLARARQEIESGKWDIVILDEVNVAVDLGLIRVEEVLRVVIPAKAGIQIENGFGSRIKSGMTQEGKPELIILTGRNAPKEFYDIADLVTEMNEVKHYYREGRIGKMGVEY